ncbi:MAG: hypothetical protein IK081_03050 [Lachnospiraceae bacterium]|nr:hypothetical protein [Lachnospiraceae bacterium]
MKNRVKQWLTAASLCLAAACLSGCGEKATYDGFTIPVQAASSLTAVSNTNVENPRVYEDAGSKDQELGSYSSKNGACKIRKMEHYYDVTLDYENFSPKEIGKAYAGTVMEAFPGFHEIIEPYVYENIYSAFPALVDDFEPVWDRVSALLETVQEDYREEIVAYAEELSGGARGFAEDGRISYEEAITFNFIPEALRGTACSALSLWGEKTANGDRITMRLLDWNLGSENQMCTVHAVIHVKKGERSFTGISFLGFENLISAINNDGVFAAILDVGSSGEAYSSNGRRCYTYDLRYALEEYKTAKEVGDFMIANSARYTWSHNLILSDADHSYCAEDAVLQLQESGKGHSVLRDEKTPLLKNLKWENPDSLCVVNSFTTEGNQDGFWINNNAVRFQKYNEWVAEKEKFTVGDLKTMITQEKVNQGKVKGEAKVENVRNQGTSQIIIVDYHTGNVQVSFTSPEGPSDDVIFTDVGSYK